MGDFIAPVFDILTCLFGYSAKWVDSIRQLGENLNSLGNDSNELNLRCLDVKMKVETTEKNPGLMVFNEVRGWMSRVPVLQDEVEVILQKGYQEIEAECFGGRCPKNCRTRYNLNKMVTQKLREVNDLISKGHFDVVAEEFARDQFEELPVDKAVGVESTLEELWSYFQDDNVGIIGLHGMLGVGKTTLLKKFNNDFLSTIPHYVVIWVVASKDADPVKIQDAIRKKVGVQDDKWTAKTEDERVLLLYNFLKKKKFVLLLDDVWERIDLLKLGVPSSKNKQCKIIFTTRLEEVCGLMDAKRCIRVNCLTSDKAFELFKEKVGEKTLKNPLIYDLIKQVVDECQGLPLTLCTTGRAMANNVTPNEWIRAIEVLRTHLSKVQGRFNSLRNASNQLNSRYRDVKMKVETAEKSPNQEEMVLNEARNWMVITVEVLQNEVEAILQKSDQEIQATCFVGRCPENCQASYKYQKKVTQKLGDVYDLINKGPFDAVAEKFACDRFEELPVDKAVGVESTLEELRSCFEDNQVGIIGLYGMPGVGKTTVLHKFNNDFLSTIPHYVVIWVVASKDADPVKIQDAIRKKVGVQDDKWNAKTVDERVLLLYNILKKKKFVLLLDDVWERIDLLKIGVPSPKNH